MPPTTKKAAAKKKTQASRGPSVPPVALVPHGEDAYAPTAWGEAARNPLDGLAEDITVPSGQLCLARRPGVQGLVAAGVLDHIDSLTALVDEKHIKRAQGKQVVDIDVKALAKDPKKLIEVLEVVDKIVCHVVLKPGIKPSPKCSVCKKPIEWHAWAPPDEVDHEPDIDIEDGVIYAFQVDLGDKMFLVNFAAGGTRSLERFRRESEEVMGGVESGDDVQLPPEPTVPHQE